MNFLLSRYSRKYLRIASFGIIFLGLYIFLSNGSNQYKIDGVIKNTKPEDVWEYVADFSKLKLLNPTILDFKITADAGTFESWKYSVVYREKLSHWPNWINEATADYVIRREDKNRIGQFVIDSYHKTCFFKGLYCLRSNGEFRFSSIGEDTYCIEKVNYQCPPFLSSLCRREVEFQRQAIFYNLTAHFHKNQI